MSLVPNGRGTIPEELSSVRLHSHHPLLLRFPGTAVGVVAVYNPMLMDTSRTTVPFAIKLWISDHLQNFVVDELWISRLKTRALGRSERLPE